MDTKRRQFLDWMLTEWGLWIRDGRSWPGLYPSQSVMPHGKPPKQREKPSQPRSKQSPILPLPQPKSTQTRPESRILNARMDNRVVVVDRVVFSMPEKLQLIALNIWCRGMSAADVCSIYSIPNRKLNKRRNIIYSTLDKNV